MRTSAHARTPAVILVRHCLKIVTDAQQKGVDSAAARPILVNDLEIELEAAVTNQLDAETCGAFEKCRSRLLRQVEIGATTVTGGE